MAAEIPISLVKFHSFPYATADLFGIPGSLLVQDDFLNL